MFYLCSWFFLPQLQNLIFFITENMLLNKANIQVYRDPLEP